MTSRRTDQYDVDAASMTLEGLRVLESGATIGWRGRTGTFGALFSPLEGEAPPAVLALTGAEHTVELLQYQPDEHYRLVEALEGDGGSVAAVLDRLAALVPTEAVARFAGGLELDAAGLREVPAVALWTGRAW